MVLFDEKKKKKMKTALAAGMAISYTEKKEEER